ncbi:MAG: carbamoyl-phosphate synthase (glutamine-hydrolyzing) large subunit [Planctomycetota bacterium]|nr:carbamoyl-phosphate synthase (glutamine-hydrolyzing) large subunit [Planctomycetota bacterium]
MRESVKKVVILGSSALKIGEAGEFDYSGSQAIKALKEEGVQTVLINPNIATIQTSDYLADQVYFLPVTPYFVEEVIKKEKPDGILLSFGGQTALNCGTALFRSGVLEKYGVRVLGTPVQAIIETEDRQLFADRLAEIGALVPRSRAANSLNEALGIARELGYPVMMRIAFALGRLGSGVCRDEETLRARVDKALSFTDQVLIEEYLEGWKEVEYEVVRDRYDNCLTVCNMENLDPLGIHTGESIVVAPSQTLSNSEYHLLRETAIRVIRHLGIVGECNIQYALDPASERYRIIEVNARLSRSSALASKATGYPLAFVAAKLALGYGLHELPNAITKVTSAFFEPALDYVVVKIPRWDLRKFKRVSRRIGSAMKSVGEVMAIGRSFEEAFQKGLRMLDIGARGVVANDGPRDPSFENLERELSEPTEQRIFAVAEALERGWTIDRVHQLSHIDEWFLHKIHRIVELEREIAAAPWPLDAALLLDAKRAGFSDEQLAVLTRRPADEVWNLRRTLGVRPVVRQIDTLAGEFPAMTNYLYLSYHGDRDDVTFDDNDSVLILGSGPYRIGSSVEFDWCCVNAGLTLRDLGYHTVMLNCNPETVSTDYDEFDRLFFDEISIETVREIASMMSIQGVIVSMGGQTPNNLAIKLHRAGIRVLGTSPDSIDAAENRHRFSQLLDEIGVDQPEWRELSTLEEARTFANKVGYPVLVRPSYVLSGAAMAVAGNDAELVRYLQRAALLSPEHPIVISKFLDNAKEIEFDAVAKDGEIVIYAISEHLENAGVHSGDATLVFPAQRTYLETQRQVRKAAKKIAERLHINGPFNIQFIAKNNDVKVIECTLRASRSFPFVSKVIRQNFIQKATRVIMGLPVQRADKAAFDLNHVGVKASQFSFTRLDGADPTLGVEMASTGEVGCLGEDFPDAFLKALVSVGYRLPIRSVLFSAGPIESKADLLPAARALQSLGVRFYATAGTSRFLSENGISNEMVNWPLDKIEPSATEIIKSRAVDLVINIPRSDQEEELTNGYMIRRAAVDYNVPLVTNRQVALRLAEALARTKLEDLEIRSWSEYAVPV